MRTQSDNGHRHAVATIPMWMVTDGVDASVDAELHYSTRDPYAVRAIFCRQDYAPVVWTFARDLLLVGLAKQVGDGDVHVFPQGPDVILRLSSPEGTAVLGAAAADVRRFADLTLGMVRVGEESAFVDVDAELATLEAAISTGGESWS